MWCAGGILKESRRRLPVGVGKQRVWSVANKNYYTWLESAAAEMNLTIAQRETKNAHVLVGGSTMLATRKGTTQNPQEICASTAFINILTLWPIYWEGWSSRGKTVRQKSSFGLVGVLNRSLVDRQIGKMQKSKQPKAVNLFPEGGKRGKAFPLN